MTNTAISKVNFGLPSFCFFKSYREGTTHTKVKKKKEHSRTMNNRVRSRVNNLIVVMTVIVFALSLIATAFFAFPDRVSALADPSSATQIGGGAELYDRDSGDFNGDVVSDLVDKLFGYKDPVEYIKTNGEIGRASCRERV